MGIPGLPPERVRLVLDHLAAGLKPYRAARAAGVSVTFAYALHHKMGGVYRPPGVTYSDRYLDREERYELARLHELGLSLRLLCLIFVRFCGRLVLLSRSPTSRNAKLLAARHEADVVRRADRLDRAGHAVLAALIRLLPGRPRAHRLITSGTVVRWHRQRPHERRHPARRR